MSRLLALVVIATLAGACRPEPPPNAEEITVWRPLGAWSGQAVLQTDPFISNTGLLRVAWQAHPATPATGTLKISLHSDVSGRRLAVVVDHRGAGQSVAYVNEDPRSFFLLIESANVDWSVEVAEGIAAHRR